MISKGCTGPPRVLPNDSEPTASSTRRCPKRECAESRLARAGRHAADPYAHPHGLHVGGDESDREHGRQNALYAWRCGIGADGDSLGHWPQLGPGCTAFAGAAGAFYADSRTSRAPIMPYDAKGCLIQSIRDDNPVIFVEHRMVHFIKGHVPEESYTVPFGKAARSRQAMM